MATVASLLHFRLVKNLKWVLYPDVFWVVLAHSENMINEASIKKSMLGKLWEAHFLSHLQMLQNSLIIIVFYL